jgi:transposase InsO family protein
LSGYDMRSSMSRKGNCWDNAVTESLWGSLKLEDSHHFESHPKSSQLPFLGLYWQASNLRAGA